MTHPDSPSGNDADPDPDSVGDLVVRLSDVSVRHDVDVVLGPLDLSVRRRERWVVLGPNGAGKTTLARVVALIRHPTTGTVEILGERWGRTDVRALQARVGLSSAALADRLRPGVTAAEIVMAGRHGALETWWHRYDDADRQRALDALAATGVAHLADRPFVTMSSGERQRVLLARIDATAPDLVVLDEPMAGLDLGARESLVRLLDERAADPTAPPSILVTHHLEEIPTATSHALLLRAGRPVAAGPVERVLTSEHVSSTFEVDVRVGRDAGRWWARAGSGDEQRVQP